MSSAIIFIPASALILVLIFGRLLGNKGIALVLTASLFIARLLTGLLFFDIGINQSIVEINLLSWVSDIYFLIDWKFVFDNVNILILLLITGVGLLIHIYSLEYMSNDPHQARFMLYLTSFTVSMLVLVTSDNLLQLFLGWEAIGIFSYLLINFWYTWLEANKSAIKAVIVNRLGDFFLSLAFFLCFFTMKTLNVYSILSIVVELQNFYFSPFNGLTLLNITLLFVLGIAAKSAQLPFHTWLVNAMSAPSPVSALIRAATLVTSGVFLIVRFSHLFELSAVLGPLSVLGVTTAFFAAATGLVQNDFKRIIAYSTCSQLGYMVFVCGLSSYNIAFFRLLNHGCFKALLFLGAGATIHTISNKQDIRYLGNLIQKLPLSYCLFFIGSLALTGFPFMTGFYSKDIIIEVAAINFHSSGTYVYLMSVLTAFMTSLYSTRLIYLVYLNTISSARRARHLTKENGLAISFSLVLLSFASVFNGFVFSEFFVGLGTDYFSNLIFNSPNHFGSILGEFLPAKLKNLPFFLCLCAISVFLVCSSSQSQMLLQLKKSKALFLTFQFLSFRWFFDLIQNKIAFIFLYLGHTLTFKLIDQGLLESLGPSGVFMNYRKSALLRNSQLGFLSHYIFTCVFFTLLLALSLSTPLSLEKLFVVFFFFICWVA